VDDLGGSCSHADLRKRLDFSDADLVAECKVHRHRASGPGGQHRNKVASAIRLHHYPSGIVVNAAESRLQGENKTRALRRLRSAIALAARVPLPASIVWPESVAVVKKRLKVNDKNPGVHHVIALVLDSLAEHQGRLADAAGALGVTSSSLTKFLRDHPKAWREAARIRDEAGLPPLRT